MWKGGQISSKALGQPGTELQLAHDDIASANALLRKKQDEA